MDSTISTSGPSGTDQAAPAPDKGVDRLLQAHKDAVGGGGSGSLQGKSRGRPRKDGSPAQAKEGRALVPQVPAVPLFNEENTGRLVGLPFTLAAVASDYPGWRLDAQEQKELAVTGSVCLNEWVRADPKWVALLLFSLSLSGVAAAKAIEYQAVAHARELERQRRAREASKGAGYVKDTPGPQKGLVAGPTQEPPTIPS